MPFLLHCLCYKSLALGPPLSSTKHHAAATKTLEILHPPYIAMAGNGHHSVAGDQDQISDLHDDLLLQILVLLPLVEAVRTCVLSHRWCHVWRRLPLLEFADDEDAPGIASFANLVAGVIHGYANDVRMPDVFISVRCPDQYDFDEAVRIAASAFLVAQRANTTTRSGLFLFYIFLLFEKGGVPHFSFFHYIRNGITSTRFGFFMSRYAVNLDWDETDEEDDEPMLPSAPLHMPCFPMVTEFALSFMGVDLRMPRNGMFENLAKLYIYGVRFTDGGEGINSVVTRQCPCLKDLELHTIEGLKTFFLVSESILRLCLLRVKDLERLLVTAKNLREMEVTKCFVHAIERTWIWLNLPKLEHLHWEDCCPEIHRWSLPRRLQKLTVIELSRAYLMLCDGGQSHFTRILQAFEHIAILRLQIPIEPVSIIYCTSSS